jgi:hypothetical protein
MDQPPASTPVQDIVSSVPEDPSDEIIDVQNADPVSHLNLNFTDKSF